MRMNDEQYEEIKQIVADIIFDYDLKYPIDIFDLAEKMGFSVIPYSFYKDNSELLINYSEDGFNQFNKELITHCIYYNDKKIKERIKFTIGHEIGHIVLNCNDNSNESNSLADFFAAYLLAPVVLIIEKKLKSPEEISNYFGISIQAAKNSLKRAARRLACNMKYTRYEKSIIESQK